MTKRPHVLATLCHLAFAAAVASHAACKEDTKRSRPTQTLVPAAPADAAPPASPPIIGTTGAVELLPDDGSPLHAIALAELVKEYGNRRGVVVARSLPEGLSKNARGGVNMIANGSNVSWVSDGDPARGYWLAYDENANGDLRDDPRHDFVRTTSPVPIATAQTETTNDRSKTTGKRDAVWELILAFQIPDPFSGELLAAPARIRYVPTSGTYAIQEAAARRGSLALPAGPMAFALIGSGGQFGLDHHYISFDLDRDGNLNLTTLDNPELFAVFEKTITIDDSSYRFELVPDGARLALHRLPTRLPPRPPLTTGTPAPDFMVSDLDGKRASLAQLRGKVVLVDFWSTTCGPCIKSLPRLAALRAQHETQGFEIFSVAESVGDVAGTLGPHRTGIAAIDDDAHALYRIDRFPMYFLIARDGTIACSRCRLAAIEEKLPSALAKPPP